MILKSKTQKKQAKYFTVITGNGGVADQILQFGSLYKLGRSLGYEYTHSRLTNNRSSKTIYQFLGINNYFLPRSLVLLKLKSLFRLQKPKFINFEFNKNIATKNKIENLKDLQNYIKQHVCKVLNDSDNRVFIIRFKCVGYAEKIYSMINLEIPELPNDFDLLDIYKKARQKEPIQSRFPNKKIKLLIHIRQGDTSIIETPWQTYIPVLGIHQRIKLKKTIEYDKLIEAEKDLKHVDPLDYFFFVQKLISYFEEDIFSMAIFSDGYERAFELISKNSKNLNFSLGQIQELENTKKSYNKEKFKLFSSLKDTAVFIGERDKSLHDLIHSSLYADIIIIGNQQKMIPKLIANYYDLENPPIMIVLYKTTKLPNDDNYANHWAETIGLSSKKAKVIPVKLDDYNMEYVVSNVKSHISKKV